MVGKRGFEPPTPASRTQCSTRLSHSPTDQNETAMYLFLKKRATVFASFSTQSCQPLLKLLVGKPIILRPITLHCKRTANAAL